MKILFIGDVAGKIGRQTVREILPKIKKDLKVDIVIANADNIAHGKGSTRSTINDLIECGVDFFSNGDHAFDQPGQIDDVFSGDLPIIRPANFPPTCPGKGYALINVPGKDPILLINIVGRVFMKGDYDCPFREIDNILANFAKQKISAIIVDVHAEATSEKMAMKYYLDGRVSIIVGTHTHIMTADHGITEAGTAYITDVGMTGAGNTSILGVEKNEIIKSFLTQIKYQHILPETGHAIFNAVLIDIDKQGKAKSIEPIFKNINIQ